MRDLLPVLRVLGMLMVMFALSMLLPFAVSWFTDDGIWRIYPWAIGITAAAGLSLWIGLTTSGASCSRATASSSSPWSGWFCRCAPCCPWCWAWAMWG